MFHRPQVKKENLITGSRLSADQDFGFDELEVRWQGLRMAIPCAQK